MSKTLTKKPTTTSTSKQSTNISATKTSKSTLASKPVSAGHSLASNDKYINKLYYLLFLVYQHGDVLYALLLIHLQEICVVNVKSQLQKKLK